MCTSLAGSVRGKKIPTAHGFDEFYGNLYHLNAAELPDYPKPNDPEFPNFRKNFGPRGVIHSFADPDGTQTIEDTGPLTRKRMETIDDDIAARAAEFIPVYNFKTELRVVARFLQRFLVKRSCPRSMTPLAAARIGCVER
jgi:arylsulfatase A-like enzyme